MPLVIGSRLGAYEIVAPLGVGGMGEVYRARDPRLNRDVAIKILARAGTDPSRQRRFAEEAQAASALNHPNILTVYDVGTHEGTPYIVSELVEGTSLRGVLARAPLPVREVLELGVQIADGLAAAHQAGIVHRDFKPENVMVTRDGRVKILDFGLALVGMRDGGAASAVDITLTAAGVIVGTVPYMSPEQARGAAVDYRTDQFSLGLTLYELLAGRRAFSAETAAQVIAAILDDEPEPIAQLNPRVPAPLRWVIERCLAKDARQRYESTTDLARELRTLRDRLNEFVQVTPEVIPAFSPRRRIGAVALTGVAATAFGALAMLTWNVGANAGPDLATYRMTPLATDSGYQSSPAWSPDGKAFAYVADVDGVLQVFTRALSSSMRAQVTHARFDCRDPFWSPDGTRLYYISLARNQDGLWSITAAGGEPELVMEKVSSAALSPDGKTLAVFRAGGGSDFRGQVWLSTPPGSPPVQYTRSPFGARPGYLNATLHFSPDGSKLGIWVEQLAGQPHGIDPEFWVLPMNGATPYVAPPPALGLPSLAAAFSWLPDSRRVLSALPLPRPGMHLWLTDTERAAPRLLTMTAGDENDPAVSADGTKIAMALQQQDYNLFQLAIEQPVLSVVLATSRNETDPAWSPRGDMMAFRTDRTGREEIWLRSQKGDWERPLVTPSDFGTNRTHFLYAPAFSPDGQRIAYSRLGHESNEIWITSVAGGPPVQLTPDVYWQEWASWSPDGGWIAFGAGARGLPSSPEHGTWSLRKMRGGARTATQVLTRDIFPQSPVRWAPDGTWIAYNSSNGLAVISQDGQSMRIVHEQAWFAFDWSADSRWLYGIRQSDDFKHMAFASVEIASGVERVLSADFRPLPPSGQSVRGFARVSPTTFLTSIADIRSDVWMLEGFDAEPTLRERVTGALRFWRR